MRIPTIQGVIDRRILINFHIDAEVAANQLPIRFKPKLVSGYAIGGICLIRLKDVKPQFLPLPCGVQSENAAHRFAVTWEADGKEKEGVYVPRRDTDSWFNAFAGGRLFPGVQHHAQFTSKETEHDYDIAIKSKDKAVEIEIEAQESDELSETSIFASVCEASAFFENGSIGYSPAHLEGHFDGIELNCQNWEVTPLNVEHVSSSYFGDNERFPEGSVSFDCALLMKNIKHAWHGKQPICCTYV